MANPIEDQGAQQLRLITKSDTAKLPLGPCRALWIGGAGDVAVVAVNDELAAPVTISAVPAGTVLPIRAMYVMSTNTTATLIVALY